jgi:hypothetical protein
MADRDMRRWLAMLGACLAIALCFAYIVRPWYLQWGATDDEARRPMVGDQIVPGATTQSTRAITIDVPANAVWPWLAQIGQDRAGFYSFDLLENLVGSEMPTDDVLRVYLQQWELGDPLWLYPPDKAGGVGFATLRVLEPGRALGFGTRQIGSDAGGDEDGSWSFQLAAIHRESTRLLVRSRGAGGRSLLGLAFDRAVFEPVHFVMERRMMVGIRQLAEGGSRHRVLNHLHVVLWMTTFGFLVASGWLVVRRPRWGRPLIAFVAAAGVFQILTLVQPSPFIGVLLLLVLLALCAPPAQESA